jgi:cellobiose phosphorylase
VRHWWHPGTDIYADSRHSDTCLWLAFATLEYLDETADFGALEKPEPYLSRQAGGPGRTDSLLEHCLRGIERMLENRSHRGLPLIGGGDWNDGLSHAGLDGKGESVWLAMFAYGVLTRMADVLGQPFGSHSCPEGAIFLNPQSWSVITGVATPERARRAMESVQEHLVKPYGTLLLHPAYRTVDPFVGYITRYAPGLRENGGVYSHASTWAVQAFAQLGDVETAYAIYKGMMPPLRAAHDADAYQAEPYVMPGNVDGPDSPYEGRAGWTWYTGSAAWMRRVALHWLLGIRPTFEGLRIEPELPQGLGPVKLIRPFRGDVLEIELHPGNGNRLTVDGRPHDGGGIAASGQGLRRKAIWGPA